MIQIPRSLVRQMRTIFTKAVTKHERSLAKVSFTSGRDGLRVRLHNNNILVEYHVDGSLPETEFVLPLDALSAIEGRGVVTLERAGDTIHARWLDGAVPQTRDFPAEDAAKLPPWPAMPKMTAMPSHFLPALVQASLVASPTAVRYATDHIQLRGKAGKVVGTDGRHLLVQSIAFPWPDDLLVPASGLYSSLPQGVPVGVGKSSNHLTLQTGPWTVHLNLSKEGRYPRTDDVIPATAKITSRCRLTPEDRVFVLGVLPRLPGANDEAAPITLDLNERLYVRARAEGQKAVEAVAAGSTASGKPVRLCLNRQFLARALELGFEDLGVVDAETPLVFHDARRQYVVMPLDKQGTLPPAEDAISISSADAQQPTRKPPRRSHPMPANHKNGENGAANGEPTASASNGTPPSRNGDHRRRRKQPNIASLVDEVSSLRAALRDAATRSGELLRVVRQRRQQDRIVQSTLKNLRQLKDAGM